MRGRNWGCLMVVEQEMMAILRDHADCLELVHLATTGMHGA